MDLGFGARLRARREERGLTLQGIAAHTKIKESLLRGLESDDLSAWPKGIFRRAFVRDYARALGLDPETVVHEFLERHPDPIEQTLFGPGGPPVTEGDLVQVHSQQGTRLQRLIDAAKTAVPSLLNRADRATRSDSRTTPAPPNPTAHAPGAPVDTDAAAPAVVLEHSVPEALAPGAALAASIDEPPASLPSQVAQSREDAQQRIDSSDDTRHAIDLQALADVCTRFALVADWEQFRTAFADTTRILDAVGVMLWCWDARTALLTPVAAHGYPDAVVARLPRIDPADSNAIAAAFRSASTRVVPADRAKTAAVAVPVFAPLGCVGVLAFELGDGREQDPGVAAAAAIIAAQLAALLTPAEESHAATA